MAVQTAASATWGIPPNVRRAIAKSVLDLRASLEQDFRRQLTALGVTGTSIQPIPGGRALSEEDHRVREVAVAVIEREREGGGSYPDAFETLVRESAFTFLNRAVGLRCMEERGLLVVDGQRETAIKTDPSRGSSSLYWRVRNELSSSTSPREVWLETLRRACSAVSQQVRVLFDLESEYAALFPLQPTLQRISDALNAPEIPPQTWAEDEVLGWVYQYYNQQEKNQVYAKLSKGKKIERPEELAAATCLYTERYMVDYLLQNTLGALWMAMHPDSRLCQSWPYYVKPPEGNPVPEREPKRVREITLMDPCCGSGHFLVRAFELYLQMYREEGIESPEEMPDLILERNLHGIDIDLRSVQIAALALYLKACSVAGPNFRPRRLNLVAADVVLPGDAPPAEYIKRFDGDRELEELVTGIWRGLRNVREFGSLLHPEQAIDEVVRRRREREKGQYWERGDVEWERWKSDLLTGLREEFEAQARSEDLGQQLFGTQAARGVSLVEALGHQYDVVVTNPPYAGSGNLSEHFRNFMAVAYKHGKRDLYASFIIRCQEFARPGGFIGMVTLQSWLTKDSFEQLRRVLLGKSSFVGVILLARHAFDEGDPPGYPVLFALANRIPEPSHLVRTVQVPHSMESQRQAEIIRSSLSRDPRLDEQVRQDQLQSLPKAQFLAGVPKRLVDLIASRPSLNSDVTLCEPSTTGDNERFVHLWWEHPGRYERWRLMAKGGGYRRWHGLQYYVLDWENSGAAIKAHPGSYIRNEQWMFKPGITFSAMSRHGISFRELPSGTTFGKAGPGLFAGGQLSDAYLALLNSKMYGFLLRKLNPGPSISLGNISILPKAPRKEIHWLSSMSGVRKDLARWSHSFDVCEWAFGSVDVAKCEQGAASLQELCTHLLSVQTRIEAAGLALEGQIENFILRSFDVDSDELTTVMQSGGQPPAWYPLIHGYDATPERIDGIGENLLPPEHPQEMLSDEELTRLKERLRILYQAGPRVELNHELEGDGEAEEDELVAVAQIMIASETFVEELSQKLEIHPVSVYRLLEEMGGHDRLICPSELKRQIEDYSSVTVLRQLGFRWPEQDTYEDEHGPIIDPDLIDEDGIVPLVPCAEQPTAEQRLHMRLARQFDEEGAAKSEDEFGRWVGRDVGEWLRRDFFKRHIQQFKQRPIAWHFTSPEGTFQAFVLYHRLSRDTLIKLRTQYAGGLIARLKGEQERARQRGEPLAVTRLQLQVEDVEEFRSRIEAIERGDQLKYRIRCRWKGEE